MIRWWPWIAAAAVSVAMPWLFYDWQQARHAGFVVSMLSQTGMMIIFALSYNMLMGQAGLLSFCHSVLFGLAGYSTVHFLNAAGAGQLPVPMELMPLLAGLSGLGFAIVFGYVATKQRSTAFAMITLGIVQLVTTAATMFHSFFGGESGVRTDRVIGNSLFGFEYGQSIEVYYLIVAWMMIAAVGMYFHTATPLGRMANACRDNHERAQFVGYDPRIVRFQQFALSGFYAGIGGGLFAITYEIVTFDAVAAPLAANALLMAYIGGATTFFGPVLGAILITLLQSGVSLMSNSWLVYVGVLFIAMVTFAPTGLTGIVLEHAPLARAGLLRRLVLPYLRILVPGLILLVGFVGLVELLSFLTIGKAQGKRLVLFGQAIDIYGTAPWLISLVCLLGGGFWFAREFRGFQARLGQPDRDRAAGWIELNPPSLSLTDITKNFGQTEIIRGVTMNVAAGERHALIGPNGAGKTTLFNLISGRFPVTSGEIRLDAARLDGLPPHRINRLGLSRSFQITSIFHRLSVFENIRCSLLWSRGYRYSFWHALGRQRALNEATERLLEDLNLAERHDVQAGLLSYAEQRALEIGMTIAGGASMVLLDEPTAGMSHSETEYAVALIRRVTQGRTLVVVEHDMRVVFDLADTITVLVYGKVIASGPPAEIRANRAVQEAYLGVIAA